MIRLFIMLIILVSCASRKSPDYDTQSVPINFDQNPKIKIDSNNASEENYGPRPIEEGEVSENARERLPIWGLYLVPSGALSIGYLEVLNELKEHKVRPKVLASSGMGALIVAMYVKYENKNIIQWKLFKLQQQLKKNKVWYGRQWQLNVKEFIDNEFGKNRIEEFDIIPLIPILKDKQIQIYSTGNLADVLKKNFDLEGKEVSYILSTDQDPSDIFQKVGVDLYRTVSLLPERIVFNSPDDFVWGVYSRLPLILRSSENVNTIGRLDYPLDEILEYNQVKRLISGDAKSFAQKMLQEQENWYEKHNP